MSRRVAILGLLLAGLAGAATDWAEETHAAAWLVQRAMHNKEHTLAATLHWDPQTKVAGDSSVAVDVDATFVPGGKVPIGYVHTRLTLPEPVDGTTVRGVRYRYRFSKSLPEGVLSSCWLSLVKEWNKESARIIRLPLQADGKWHTEEFSFLDHEPTPPDWDFDTINVLGWNFYVNHPPEGADSVAFTFQLDDVQLLEKEPPATRRPALWLSAAPDPELAPKLRDAGFSWYTPRHSYDIDAILGLTGGQLRDFDAVVLTCYPQIGTGGLDDKLQHCIDTLRQFVDRGGSLVLFGGNNQDMGKCVAFQNALLAPYGGTVLREYVADPETAWTGQAQFHYAWTDNIARDPLTEGVRGLFFPTMGGWGGTSFTNPVRVDDPWTILVRGSTTAQSFGLNDDNERAATPTSYAGAPPLLAVRQAGKGRIVLWPTLATCTLVDGYHFVWDHGLVLEGSARQPSDGLRLLVNLLEYAVAPSRDLPRYGGYLPPRPDPPPPAPPSPPFLPKLDSYEVRSPFYAHAWKVLIGPRTALSTGKGAVADYAAAAKTQGYDAVVFAEDMAAMDEAKWTQLKAACRAATTDDFVAVEGFRWLDEAGNQGVVFGDVGWVKPDWLSPEQPGRIKTQTYFTNGYRFWPPVAVITPKHNPKEPWFLGKCKGFAAYTYANGELVDDSLDLYLRMWQSSFQNWVVAVHLLDDPARVADAARPGNMQTFIRADKLSDAIGALADSNPRKTRWTWPAYVSSGPELLTSQGGLPRFRIHAVADQPLREVRLMDGPRLVRRFLPGTPEFDHEVRLFPDHQYRLVTIVTDAAGRQAVSWGTAFYEDQQWSVNCGDNWNIMEGGIYTGSAYYSPRGVETHLHPRQPGWTWPGGTVTVAGEKRRILPSRPAIHVIPRTVSRFCSVMDFEVRGAYREDASANWNCFAQRPPIGPLDTARSTVRRIFFTPRPDGTRVNWIQGRIEFLQPATTSGHAIQTGVCNLNGDPGDLDHATVYDGDTGETRVVVRPANRRENLSVGGGPLQRGGYVAAWPYYAGCPGVFALDDHTRYYFAYSPTGGQFSLWFSAGAGDIPAGHVAEYQYLTVVGPAFVDPPSNAWMEEIRAGLGLQGTPAYTVEPTVGDVLSTAYALTVRADDGGFRGTFSQAKLPCDLPVMVTGLNDNWQVLLWYRGRLRFLRPQWQADEIGQRRAVRTVRTHTDAILPGPVFDGTAYLGLDLELSPREIFMGHPVVGDHPELFVQLDDWRPGQAAVGVHNPTDAAVTTTVRNGKGFDYCGAWTRQVTVPPGATVRVPLQ